MAPLEKKTLGDYTVGWICALQHEQTAAKAFLDQRHANLKYPEEDQNFYVLGSIGKHNVAISWLVMATPGTSAATAVARDMTRTFPNIRIGLMVGIGGGIPSKVRLGDVVISAPVGTWPGVVQWDLGKQEGDGTFTRTGSLSRPPPFLLKAVMELVSEDQMGNSRVMEYLHDLPARWPTLAARFTWSERLKDPWTADPTTDKTKKRKQDILTDVDCQRKEEDFRVVYGLIASGNSVIKNAAHRDQLSKCFTGDLFCVEMEAAGLVDNFPGLIIRGICDYADEKKNDDWQDYAAARAAAVAKELLLLLEPAEVESQDRAHEVITRIGVSLSNVEETLHKAEHIKLLDGLSDLDYGTTQSYHESKTQEGTGLWFLNSDDFRFWRDGVKQTLFCQGMPGAGKTKMTSIIIAHLERYATKPEVKRLYPQVGIAYIYFTFSSTEKKPKLGILLASLLKQLASRCSSLPEELRKTWAQHSRTKTQPSSDELSRQLQIVASTFSRVFILIDALDECKMDLCNLAKLLQELFQIQKQCNLNIFATSRPVPRINRHFQVWQTVEIKASYDDVYRYLETEVNNPDCRLAEEDARFKAQMITEIANAAQGMFLMAKLFLKSLPYPMTTNGIQESIRAFQMTTTPESSQRFIKVYQVVMERLLGQEETRVAFAKNVLFWVASARRPLKVAELLHAISTRPGATDLDAGDLVSVKDVLEACVGLVVVGECDTIRLVHYTTETYLRQDWARFFSGFEQNISKVCVTYLLFKEFSWGACSSLHEYSDRLQRYPFYEYAAQYWAIHLDHSLVLAPPVLELLQDNSKRNASYQAILVSGGNHRMVYLYHLDETITGVQLASILGLAEAVKYFLDRGIQPGFHVNTLMYFAAKYGHSSVVELLLQSNLGLYIDGPVSYDGLTALHIAAANGHAVVVERLLHIGACVNARQELTQPTALMLAAEGGHLAVAQMLVGKSPDVNAVYIYNSGIGFWKTALLMAAECGQSEIVDELLKAGANVNEAAPGSYRARTALQVASERGHVDVVNMLLEKGADVNAPAIGDISGRTALQAASEKGHLDVIETLLDCGADVNAAAGPGWLQKTALQAAAQQGRFEVFQRLRAANADVDAARSTLLGRTVLQAANDSDSIDIVSEITPFRDSVNDSGGHSPGDDHSNRQPAPWPAVPEEFADMLKELATTRTEMKHLCELVESAQDYRNPQPPSHTFEVRDISATFRALDVATALLAIVLDEYDYAIILDRKRYIGQDKWSLIRGALESANAERSVHCGFFLVAVAMVDLGLFEEFLEIAVERNTLKRRFCYPGYPKEPLDNEAMCEALQNYGARSKADGGMFEVFASHAAMMEKIKKHAPVTTGDRRVAEALAEQGVAVIMTNGGMLGGFDRRRAMIMDNREGMREGSGTNEAMDTDVDGGNCSNDDNSSSMDFQMVGAHVSRSKRVHPLRCW